MEKYENIYQLQLLKKKKKKNIAFYEFLGLKRVEKYGCCAFIR